MSAGITVTATAAEKGRHITVAANGVGVLHSDKLDLQSAPVGSGSRRDDAGRV